MRENVTNFVNRSQSQTVTQNVVHGDTVLCPYSGMKNNLANVRKKLGLNQEEFADMIGISRVHMSRLENGVNHMPLGKIKKIVDKINAHYQSERVTVWEFFLDEHDVELMVQNEEEKKLLMERRSLEEAQQSAFDAMTSNIAESLKNLKN